MSKIRMTVAALAFCVAPQIFAASDSDSSASMAASGTRPCMAVVKACMDAGYIRRDHGSKKIWQNCMKPLLMGNTVNGVKIDPNTVATCRADKIKKLKAEIQELQAKRNSQ